MNLLFRVIHASRCRSTHHKVAVDALRHLKCSFAERWRNLFLKHVDVYLDGAKAPDTRFKDFRNHVLHVQDNYWGGAPKTARKWYDMTVRGLRSRNWVQAVYAAGVLSHYYTDPIQPFHTAQSEAENNIHRAAEWSITKSYDDLYRLLAQKQVFPQVNVPEGEDWLEQMVIDGAELSNVHYESLIERYSFDRGVREPRAGLDANCRQFLSELLGHAQVGVARILEKAIAQARVSPPVTLVNLRGVLATIKMPFRWIARKIADVHERSEIEAIYRELKSTGKVERTLPADDRAVRELHAQEVVAKRGETGPTPPASADHRSAANLHSPREPRDVDRGRTTATQPPPPPPFDYGPTTRSTAGNYESAAAGPSPARHESQLSGGRTPSPSDNASDKANENTRTTTGGPQPRSRDTLPHRPYLRYPNADADDSPNSTQPRTTGFDQRSETTGSKQSSQTPRYYLEVTSNVVDAPSVGPKTAKRLKRVGVRTVADLLRINPESASAKLGTRHITPQVLRDWQDQARLVCRIPGLRGHDAQILVGCGYRQPEEIARAGDRALHARVEPFAATSEGQRILRSSAPPDLNEIRDWIRWSQSSRSLEAA